MEYKSGILERQELPGMTRRKFMKDMVYAAGFLGAGTAFTYAFRKDIGKAFDDAFPAALDFPKADYKIGQIIAYKDRVTGEKRAIRIKMPEDVATVVLEASDIKKTNPNLNPHYLDGVMQDFSENAGLRKEWSALSEGTIFRGIDYQGHFPQIPKK